MAGLLDFLNTPDAQLGMGLLAAAGPRSDGAGFGQRLTEGMGYAQAQQDAALKRKMMQLQEQRAQAAFQMQQDAYAGIPGSGGGPGAQSGFPASSGQTGTGGAANGTMGGQPGGDTNAQLVRLEKMAIAGVPGAKEAFEIYKYRNDPQQLQPGTFSQNRVTGQREYIPDVKTGMGYGSNGMYALPGSGVIASLEGDKQAAIERAKAGLDLVDVPDGQGGTQKMPRAQAVQLLGGGQNRASPAPAGYASEPQMRSSAGGDMGADPQGAQREIARATADLKKTSDPTSRQILKDHITEMQRQLMNIPASTAASDPQTAAVMPAAPRWGASQTVEQKIAQEAATARAVDTGKADVVRDTGKIADTKRFGQFTAGVDRAIDLLGQGPTASGMGSAADSAASFFGRSTKGADLASQLDTVSGWLTANVPRMEGPQSDKDVVSYRIMAGMVGDRTKPVSQRLAAAQEVKALQNKYAELNGGAANTGGAGGEWGNKPKPPAPIPMKGMVRGGYKFKGGEPSDQNNWEKM